MQPIIKLFLAVIAATALATAFANEKPPPGAMALSTVLTKLEQQGYTPIVEVDLDNGKWKVEAYKGGQKYDLKVDPNTAEIESEKPDN
ncbi:PepSY domain-containing protein [Microbulbifer sp. OS29]|uniref:PepSY domain-containing protein n=1 Tax=Microbulbifer okhotskensis TaxID=2926617 RepID=A0A9X2ERH2_9GAMM|nr:PepSY domain-containing protein [Microbulbifer okhotskensis]MCO1334203.1 PepSY domain-containing protein [Microbulbifer okhotskensis]